MTNDDEVEIIFQPDETRLRSVNPEWTAEELLAQEGIFFLKDITKILDISPQVVKNHVFLLQEDKKDAWELVGVRKAWTHWLVRMKNFRPAYHSNEFDKLRVQSIPPHLNGNEVLQLQGAYYLKDIVEKLPFTIQAVRSQIRNNPQVAKRVGARKLKQQGYWVVSMPALGTDLQEVWNKTNTSSRAKNKVRRGKSE